MSGSWVVGLLVPENMDSVSPVARLSFEIGWTAAHPCWREERGVLATQLLHSPSSILLLSVHYIIENKNPEI